MRARRLILPALLATLFALAAGSAPAAALGRCTTVPSDRTLCGRVTVPLDVAGAVPGTVSLRVKALPPSGGGAAQATVLALAGGPGQAATPLLSAFAGALGPVLRTRELVTFDQRGTGGSGLLRCDGLMAPGSLASSVFACANQIGPGRADYTTAASVADVEAVRAALGVDKLIVYGTSYGTKVALEYAATYPRHVDRLVLDSTVPPDGIDPFQRSTLASVPRVLRGVCDGDCRFTRSPGADVAALARRLERARLRGRVVDGHGHASSASLSQSGLLGLLLQGDFDRYLRAALPAAVRGALHGDPAPLLRLSAGAGGGAPTSGADSDAVYLATTCEDGMVPWAAGTPLQQRHAAEQAAAAAIPNSAFAPFDRASALALGLADLCRGWPEAPIAQPLPPLPATPTLILSGDEDLRTPRADALALARRLPGAHMVAVPDSGHGALFSDPTDCAERAVAAFVGGLIPGDCPFHPPVAAALGLAPRRLTDLRGAGHVRGLPGRTVTAVLRTLDDASEQLIEQVAAGGAPQPFGGLRAGSAGLDGSRGLRLRAYSYVPGVTVSGLLPSRGSRFTLTVGGRAAARGRLLVSRAGVAGTLGGVSVRIPARALGWRGGGAAARLAARLLARADAAAPAHAADDPRPFGP
ncbi:MAG TPA: alpha/beta hydrolase [Conexibacter sp.]|nr:alpha/beta hydrolase [Conexibacter sp.]